MDEQCQEYLSSVHGIQYAHRCKNRKMFFDKIRTRRGAPSNFAKSKGKFDEEMVIQDVGDEPAVPCYPAGLPEYLGLFDLLSVFPKFVEIIEKHRAKINNDGNLKIDYSQLEKDIKKILPKSPKVEKEWRNQLAKHIRDNEYMGPSVNYGMTINPEIQDLEKRYKTGSLVFNLGKTKFKTLLRLMILSKNVYSNGRLKKVGLYRLQTAWEPIQESYGLSTLPDLKRLSRELKRYQQLCGYQQEPSETKSIIGL
ncbi:MAG: hypothetical protein NTV24_05385 [Candidatus Woesebacteria bacterium]|nr:hypothetical protein [Candidatus Woesebacteria bacterium]